MRSSSGVVVGARLGLVERRQVVLAAVGAERAADARRPASGKSSSGSAQPHSPAVLVRGAEQRDAHLEVVVEEDRAGLEVDLPAAVADDGVGVQLLLEGEDRVAIDVRLEAHCAWSIRPGGSADEALLVTSSAIRRP